jgi:phage terminase small subunit
MVEKEQKTAEIDTVLNKLRPKVRAFVLEYVKTFNATEAAKTVGYSENSAVKQGSRLLTNEDVRNAVEVLAAQAAEDCGVTTKYVLEHLKEVVARCLQKTPVMEWSYEDRALVQKRDEAGNGFWEFDSSGANKALELLGKYRKMFTDKVALENVDALATQLKNARDRVHGKPPTS